MITCYFFFLLFFFLCFLKKLILAGKRDIYNIRNIYGLMRRSIQCGQRRRSNARGSPEADVEASN